MNKMVLMAGGIGAASGLVPKFVDTGEYGPAVVGGVEIVGGIVLTKKQPALAAGMVALGARELAGWLYDYLSAPAEEETPTEAGATYFPPNYYDAGSLLSAAPDSGALMGAAPDAGAAFVTPGYRRRASSFMLRPAT